MARKKKQEVDVDKLAYQHEHQCDACPLKETWDSLYSPFMEPTGEPASNDEETLIYVLAEAPAVEEDKRGEQLIGKSGKVLRREIPKKYRGQVVYDNTIRCYKPIKDKPTWEETEACRPYIETDILYYRPKFVIAVGSFALSWFVLGENISSWSGRCFPAQIEDHKFWVFPVIHPASTLYNPELLNAFQEHFRLIFKQIEELEEPVLYPKDKVFDGISIITKGTEFEIDYIKEVFADFETKGESIGIDIETNGLRPYAEGAKILSIAIGNEDKTIAIPLHHSQTPWTPVQLKAVERLVVDFLMYTRCRKVAKHLGFEMEWLGYFFGYKLLRAGRWDDVQAQYYCLDTRQGANNLDSLVLQYFGFNLKSCSPTDVTNLDNEPLEDVLRYNGADSKFEDMLFRILQDELEYDGMDEAVYDEQIARVATITLAQLFGMDVDFETIENIEEKVESKIREAEYNLQRLDVVKKYEKIHDKLNPDSPKQVICVLKDFVKAKECEVKKGKYSSDEKTLQRINHPFAKAMLDYRKSSTLKKMFVKPISKNHGAKVIWPDGKLHTKFTSDFTRTRRLSSRDPNLQQLPHRVNAWIREYIVPPKDHVLVSVDYGAIEARVIAAASQDQYLINALWERYDIHAEWARKLYKLYPRCWNGDPNDPKQFKDLRHKAKNEFVFPSFYGADYSTCAYYLGIPDEKVKRIQEEFWNTFSGVAEWQERELDFYLENHYLLSLTGFKYRAPLELNKIFNYPTQGGASDIVVDSMNRLSCHAQETEQWQFQSRINVHDDLVSCLPVDSLEDDFDVIIHYMLDTPYEFIHCVPVVVEAKIGENWFDMETVGDYSSDKYLGKTRT